MITPSAAKKQPAPVRMGEPSAMCSILERLDRLELKIDDLIQMLKPVFSDKSMRIAIGAAITSSSMQFPRR
jgi:hypothetical protein